MNPVFALILKIFARKVADKHLEKNEERKEAVARGEISAEKPRVNPFKNFWSLDDEKTRWQGVVTLFFFMAIVSAMDAIIFMPFVGNEDAAQIIDMIEKFPPSYFVGVALTVLVMVGRDIQLWLKAALVAASIGGGFMMTSAVALLPILYLLQKPLAAGKEEADEVAVEVSDDVIETSLDPQVHEPQEIKVRPMGDGETPDDFVDPIDDFLKKD